MAPTPNSLANKNSTSAGNSKPPLQSERRSSRRCKLNQLMRIRPSDPANEAFDDIRRTLSVSRTGVYFQTSEPDYQVGMRLFVSLPYATESATMDQEYLTEVVRRDPLPNGLFGIGFKFLMQIRLEGGYSFGSPQQRR
jgi:hypothetical protein